MSGFMKKFSRALPRRFFLQSERYEIKRNVSRFLLHSFILFSLLSFPYFLPFCVAWRLPLGVVKSKGTLVIWRKLFKNRFHISSHTVCT